MIALAHDALTSWQLAAVCVAALVVCGVWLSQRATTKRKKIVVEEHLELQRMQMTAGVLELSDASTDKLANRLLVAQRRRPGE